ncbi:MAG: hypothetical protein JWO37_3009 [Acidimicrobiales bacterium]|jgi:hypothetical protein|nr:hypothetical protein [Acidimicrobiales bacterium]
MFWYPLAGVTWQFIHFIVGLRRLGWDVYYVEDSERWGVYDPRTNSMTADASGNIARVVPLLERHGLGSRWAFHGKYLGGSSYGLAPTELRKLYAEATAMLNVTGGQELREEHLACPLRIYVETDPVASQVALVTGSERARAALANHHFYFSFGENFGAPDCHVPIVDIEWKPTRQPVLLDMWADESSSPANRYTTIATWSNDGKDVVLDGETYYWSKDREFLKLMDLPRRCRATIELAVGVDDATHQALTEHGWQLTSSIEVSRDLESYRRYIQASRGEFTVAKDQNIRLRSGWFSDRSACYLAAGRPVVTQETGFSNVLPTGAGLYSFETVEDAAAAIEAIEADYDANRNAAREIAREYFAADRVLGSLLERSGL